MISGARYTCSLSSLLLSWAAEAEENPSGTANALMLGGKKTPMLFGGNKRLKFVISVSVLASKLSLSVTVPPNDKVEDDES